MSSVMDSANSQSSQALVDLLHLLPLTIVGGWILLLLLTDAFSSPGLRSFQRRMALTGLALATLAGLRLFGDNAYDAPVAVFSGFLVVDHFSMLLDLALLACAAGVVAFGGEYARGHRFEYGEQEPLVLTALFGAMTLAHSNDLTALFLGVETMSIAVYVLVGARWNSRQSSEAALKYFLMGAFASALLLMGIALLYGATGGTSFDHVSNGVTSVFTSWGSVQTEALALENRMPILYSDVELVVRGMAPAALFIPGLLLVLAALLFKISAAPLHMWTPDAYEGAPSPTTAFMSSVVKLGAFAVLLRLFVGEFHTYRLVTAPYGWTSIVAWLALLTMTVGNFAAVRQPNIKRLLAYSSIAHVGYALVGVVAAANFYGQLGRGSLQAADSADWARTAGDAALSGVLYYLITYAVASIGTFACVSWLGNNRREAVNTHEWAGLGRRAPAMALGMTICIISLMGLPPTAGFFGKLFVFRAAFENDNPLMRVLVIAALLNSVVGAYYYLRLIVSMYFRPEPAEPIATLPGRGAPIVLAISAVLVVGMGVMSSAVLRRTDLAAAGFGEDGQSRAALVDKLRARWEVVPASVTGDQGSRAVRASVD